MDSNLITLILHLTVLSLSIANLVNARTRSRYITQLEKEIENIKKRGE